MKINLLTAKPAFELMLATRELRAPYSYVEAAWEVFLEYLRVPSDAAQDVGCFQTTFVEPEGNETRSELICMFARLLVAADGEKRCVQLIYSLKDKYAGKLDDIEVWSDSYPDIPTFAAHVEALDHFRVLCADSGPYGEVYVEYDE